MKVDPTAIHVMYSDGASRGNPGLAAAGYVILNPAGDEVVAQGDRLGDKITNNVAEYESLLRGMRAAEAHGIKRLTVRMDSQLVVRQMQGQYKVRHAGLRPLFDACRAQAGHFEIFEIEHVPRAENARADELANEALDAEN